jgi:hypothetical protein
VQVRLLRRGEVSPAERILYARMRRRAADLQPDLARRLLRAYDLIRRGLTSAELELAIRTGTVERLLDELLADPRIDPALAGLRELVQRRVLEAGLAWARDLPSRFAAPMFDTLNPRVLDAVRELDSRVMRALKEEVRASVRQASRVALEEGVGPRELGRRIREAVGLAPAQEEAVANFRRLLEEGDRAALTRELRDRRFDRTLQQALGRNDTGLSADQVEKMVDAYRRRMVAHNAETHARSAANDAQRLAQRLSWENAIAQGTVSRDRLFRKWVDTGDRRVRPEHVEMGKTEAVHFDQPYLNGEMVPGESTYNCRCVERYIIRAEEA